MISIIVCSRSPEFLQQVSRSIELTIGVAYEIIAIDNRSGQYGICEAYNQGAARSQYPFLCFMHEDILFHTDDWGKKVIGLLQDENIGAVGVAGATAKFKAPSGWFVTDTAYWRKRIRQHYAKSTIILDEVNNPLRESCSSVVNLDGVWICCRKSVWEASPFDSRTFRAFHFYDLDFTMQLYVKGYRLYVWHDLFIEHLSEGNINASWGYGALQFARKWQQELPVSVYTLNVNEVRRQEHNNQRYFMELMLERRFVNVFLLAGANYLRQYPSRKNFKWLARRLMQARFPGALRGILQIYHFWPGRLTNRL